MNDPITGITISLILFVGGIYLGIRYSAEASIKLNSYSWWLKACFRAKQREEYAAYSKQLAKQDSTKENVDYGL